MRDRTSSFLCRVARTGLLVCALGVAAPAHGDDLFDPAPARPVPASMLQCPAAAAQGADLETRIHQVQRRIAAGSAALPGPFGHGVMLNNAGFNYGGSSREVDPGALSFEAKLAH